MRFYRHRWAAEIVFQSGMTRMSGQRGKSVCLLLYPAAFVSPTFSSPICFIWIGQIAFSLGCSSITVQLPGARSTDSLFQGEKQSASRHIRRCKQSRIYRSASSSTIDLRRGTLQLTTSPLRRGRQSPAILDILPCTVAGWRVSKRLAFVNVLHGVISRSAMGI